MGKREYEPGEVYWSLVEPFWGKISIYDGAEQFLRQFRALPKHVGHLFAGHWCQSEVCNGGFHQFFWNPTGILAPEALQAYQAIGIPVWAAIVKEAMQYLVNRTLASNLTAPFPSEYLARSAKSGTPSTHLTNDSTTGFEMGETGVAWPMNMRASSARKVEFQNLHLTLVTG
jgi:Domain of unknown function (DUF4375)